MTPDDEIKTERIAAILRSLPIGEVASYRDVAMACGGEPSRWLLITARKQVETDTGARFATVRKVGIKKLASGEIVGIGAAARRRVGRIAKAQSRRLVGLSYNGLSDDDRARIDVERSLLGAICAASGAASAKALADSGVTGPQVSDRVFDILRAK